MIAWHVRPGDRVAVVNERTARFYFGDPDRAIGATVNGNVRIIGVVADVYRRYGFERYSKETHRLYGVMDRRLATHEYFAGDVSIADFALVGWAWRHERHKVDLAQYPNVQRWYQAMMSRPVSGTSSTTPPRTATTRCA